MGFYKIKDKPENYFRINFVEFNYNEDIGLTSKSFLISIIESFFFNIQIWIILNNPRKNRFRTIFVDPEKYLNYFP